MKEHTVNPTDKVKSMQDEKKKLSNAICLDISKHIKEFSSSHGIQVTKVNPIFVHLDGGIFGSKEHVLVEVEIGFDL